MRRTEEKKVELKDLVKRLMKTGDIKRVDLETRILFERYQHCKDETVKNEIVMLNCYVIGFSLRKVMKNIPANVNVVSEDDLISEGILALYDIVDKYDYKSDASFATFAEKWVWGQMMEYVRKNSRAVKLPTKMEADVAKIKVWMQEYYKTHAHEPKTADMEQCWVNLQDAMDNKRFRFDRAVDFINASTYTYSEEIMDNMNQYAERPVHYLVQEEKTIDQHVNEMDISNLLSKLTEQEQFVIKCYYFLGMTIKEISEKYKLNARYLKRKALNNLSAIA